jgi:hypothetical protein
MANAAIKEAAGIPAVLSFEFLQNNCLLFS